MVDLNTLIPSNSTLELIAADNINERGEVVGVGVPAKCFPDFCERHFLLIPCATDDDQDCGDKGRRRAPLIRGTAPRIEGDTAGVELGALA